MRNVLAIAGREMRSYFASPIAYFVIGLFALIFGWFFYAILVLFAEQSLRMGQMMGPSSLNVNQMLIRPLLLNASVVVLFFLPMVTMRTFAEEKRSGTFELLLTSPVTDAQLVLGKFLGAMALFAMMLLVTGLDVALLFWFGNPEWKQVASAYLGLLLMGGAFISIGLFFSSVTRNQIVAVALTFATLLMLWVINWVADSAGPTLRAVLEALSITDHYDDFSKGVIDTKHIVYYLSFITFGLFLTAKSVDSERWRG
ncbi:MAG: ybhR 2 [Acidobacteria bacterium]|nr:ybhR 2 [Acidobacteriota bacterium]